MSETPEAIAKRIFEREAPCFLAATELVLEAIQKETSEIFEARVTAEIVASLELQEQCDKHVKELKAKSAELSDLQQELDVMREYKEKYEEKMAELKTVQEDRQRLQGENAEVRGKLAEKEREVKTLQQEACSPSNKEKSVVPLRVENEVEASARGDEGVTQVPTTNKYTIQCGFIGRAIETLPQEVRSQFDMGKRTAPQQVVNAWGSGFRQEEIVPLVSGSSDDESHVISPTSESITPSKRKSIDIESGQQSIAPALAHKEPALIVQLFPESQTNNEGGGSSCDTGNPKTPQATVAFWPIPGGLIANSNPSTWTQQSTETDNTPTSPTIEQKIADLRRKLKIKNTFKAGDGSNLGCNGPDPYLGLCSLCRKDVYDTPFLGAAAGCFNCPRICHMLCLWNLHSAFRKCSTPGDLPHNWLCRICEALKGEAERFMIEETTSIQEIVTKLDFQMRGHEFSRGLRKPVDLEEFSDYETFVSDPMDLGTAFTTFQLDLPQSASRTSKVQYAECTNTWRMLHACSKIAVCTTRRVLLYTDVPSFWKAWL